MVAYGSRKDRKRPPPKLKAKPRPKPKLKPEAPVERMYTEEQLKHYIQGTAATALVLFGVYKYITRQPTNDWFQSFVEKHKGQTDFVNVWIPGVSTKNGYDAKIRADLEKTGNECFVAWFPYSSAVITLDLVAALVDKLPGLDFRPQVVNIQLALAVFLSNFKKIHITAHSHGGLLVKRALEGLRLGEENGGRITVGAFGPASLVPWKSNLYQVGSAINWVNEEDILVQRGILKMPPGIRWHDENSQELKGEGDRDGEMYVINARNSGKNQDKFRKWCPLSDLKLGGFGIGAHSCYPFKVGLRCKAAGTGVEEIIDLTGS